MLSGLTNKVGKVGWFKSAQYPDGTSVAMVAAIQEYGSPAHSIPPRLGMRQTISENQEKWKRTAARISKKVVRGEAEVKDVLEAVILQAEGDMRRTISKVQEPPLKLSTLILRKQRKLGNKTTGKSVGEAVKQAENYNFVGPRPKGQKNPKINISGVSKKPLVDTRVLINTLTSAVENK